MSNIDIEKIMQAHLNEQVYTCDVEIPLHTIVESNPIGFLHALSHEATGTPEGIVMGWRVVDFKGDAASTLIFQIDVDVDAVPAYWDDVQAPEGWKA